MAGFDDAEQLAFWWIHLPTLHEISIVKCDTYNKRIFLSPWQAVKHS